MLTVVSFQRYFAHALGNDAASADSRENPGGAQKDTGSKRSEHECDLASIGRNSGQALRTKGVRSRHRLRQML